MVGGFSRDPILYRTTPGAPHRLTYKYNANQTSKLGKKNGTSDIQVIVTANKEEP